MVSGGRSMVPHVYGPQAWTAWSISVSHYGVMNDLMDSWSSVIYKGGASDLLKPRKVDCELSRILDAPQSRRASAGEVCKLRRRTAPSQEVGDHRCAMPVMGGMGRPQQSDVWLWTYRVAATHDHAGGSRVLWGVYI